MKEQNTSFGIGLLLGIILTAMVFIGFGLSSKVNQPDRSFDPNFDLNHSEILSK